MVINIFIKWIGIVLGLKNLSSITFYDKINPRVEKWSKIIYFVIAKVTFAVIFLPKILISLYNYFVMNLDGNADSLELPLPMW